MTSVPRRWFGGASPCPPNHVPADVPRGGRRRRVASRCPPILRAMRRWGSLLAFALGTVALFGGATGPTAAAPRDDVRILASAAESLDPAAQGDISSAAVTAQMYESLTAFDASLVLRPALAASWTTSDAGKTDRVHLATRSDVLRRDAPDRDGRRPQLDASHRPEGAVATRVAPRRRRRCRGVSPAVSSPTRPPSASPRRAISRSSSVSSDRSATSMPSSRERRSASSRRGSPRAADADPPAGERRLQPVHGRLVGAAPHGQRPLLGRSTGHRQRRPRHRHRRAERRRRLHRRRRRLRPDLVVRCGVDRLRHRPRAEPARGRVASRLVLRLRRESPAVRRRAGPTGVRPRRPLASHRRARASTASRLRPRAWSRPASRGDPIGTSCRPTIRAWPSACWPRPATPAAPASRR